MSISEILLIWIGKALVFLAFVGVITAPFTILYCLIRIIIDAFRGKNDSGYLPWYGWWQSMK